MTKIGIIRCEKNEHACPLTNCFKCLTGTKQGFAGYEDCELAGVFTCRCPGDNVAELARILKAKGAEAIHFPTCTFAHKRKDGWELGDGFCPDMQRLMEQAGQSTGLPCVKGTAHLPEGYTPEAL
ncbi:Predicted metal-binding protein [Paucidesulfovibrio gracilis DSM 16080]|uniref:Predicted metal-binding protein n=1 Tax=Paucidesulfovibrio gracilis DSM 16080 TaxID=1121449 RepID=A0A1T4W8N2_9BACT|nr:CGGC domain-containing protein [Paucidesulfovibrio gracilis]SKA73623.1 Predicted metal-binding protein [Paucidesulfovibrio gracilis DSM 16080]